MDTIETIEERNRRVDDDKAWETSLARRTIIAGITYGIAALFMYRIGVEGPFLNALVPTGGYILSTLSLVYVKRWWLRVCYKDK